MDALKEIIRKSGERRELRKFGLTMAAVLLALGLFALWRGKPIAMPLLVGAGLLLFSALILPVVLRILYIPWMFLAFILGWVMTRVILFLTFYVMITPMGLLMRLFGKDLLSTRFPGKRDSYWESWEEPEGGHERHFKPF